MMISCEAPQLAINILQTAACSRIQGSYEHEPIPIHAKSDLTNHLPLWCAQPTATYRLIAVGAEKVYKLGGESFVTVGRNTSAKVVLSSLSVSRMHAAFMHDSLNQTFLVDLGSSHGTFIGLERLKPYTPTLVTNKSLIRFGTCELQHLLVTVCPEMCIAREAMAKETEEDRELYLNTQFNLINMLPVDGGGAMDDTDLSFSRLDTFNFVHSMKNPPALKRVQISCDSVAACSETVLSPVCEILQPISIREPDYQNTMSGYESPAVAPLLSSAAVASSPSSFQGYCVADNTTLTANGGIPISISSSPELPSTSCFEKRQQGFIFTGSLPGEPSIKRCATLAGVDEEETADFAPCNILLANDEASTRWRRRRMSEDPHDFGYDSGRSMSLSLDCGELASIGGSSTGFISSGSMSECEEEVISSEKKKLKVRFWDFPMVIPEPLHVA